MKMDKEELLLIQAMVQASPERAIGVMVSIGVLVLSGIYGGPAVLAAQEALDDTKNGSPIDFLHALEQKIKEKAN